mmetsp:Transcript_11418/g.25618  ORF Transcript_11418/g.25618 Transcript_11418/m.25618 type:complete len:301 (-) Transcript_11418:675-1577(-)
MLTFPDAKLVHCHEFGLHGHLLKFQVFPKLRRLAGTARLRLCHLGHSWRCACTRRRSWRHLSHRGLGRRRLDHGGLGHAGLGHWGLGRRGRRGLGHGGLSHRGRRGLGHRGLRYGGLGRRLSHRRFGHRRRCWPRFRRGFCSCSSSRTRSSALSQAHLNKARRVVDLFTAHGQGLQHDERILLLSRPKRLDSRFSKHDALPSEQLYLGGDGPRELPGARLSNGLCGYPLRWRGTCRSNAGWSRSFLALLLTTVPCGAVHSTFHGLALAFALALRHILDVKRRVLDGAPLGLELVKDFGGA